MENNNPHSYLLNANEDLFFKYNEIINLIDDDALFYDAYKIVVDELRLNPVLLPIKFSSGFSYGNVNEITSHGIMGISEYSPSKIAIKEVTNVIGADLKDGTIATIANSNWYFGDKTLPDGYGFTSFESFNKNHSVKPSLVWIGNHIQCTNINDSNVFCFLECYIYPYPVLVSDAEQLHTYDVQEMITTHGIDNLLVDPLLGVLIICKANANSAMDNGDIDSFNQYEYFYKNIINLYNSNNISPRITNYTLVDSINKFSNIKRLR